MEFKGNAYPLEQVGLNPEDYGYDRLPDGSWSRSKRLGFVLEAPRLPGAIHMMGQDILAVGFEPEDYGWIIDEKPHHPDWDVQPDGYYMPEFTLINVVE